MQTLTEKEWKKSLVDNYVVSLLENSEVNCRDFTVTIPGNFYFICNGESLLEI